MCIRFQALGLALVLGFSGPAFAQTSPIVINQGTYFQSFDALGSGMPANLSGWAGFKISGNGGLLSGTFITTSSTPSLTTADGSDGNGTVYNFGSAGSSDRALGTVSDVQTTPGFGVLLVNNTGRILTAEDVLLGFRMEHWRRGSASNIDEVWQFQFRTFGTTLDVNDTSSAGWSTLTTFDLNEIQTGSSGAAPQDGNAVGNFVTVAPTMLSGLVWNPGDRLVLRWMDTNNLGSDSGMAIDDFSLTVLAPVPEPSMLATRGACLLAALFLPKRRLRKIELAQATTAV